MISEPDILGASILIVDDHETNVRLLNSILRNAGYSSITSTTNPLEVCALHLNKRYDLILLDIQMEGMDGFQVMEGLKEIEKDDYLPVIVITSQPDYKLRALQLGAKDSSASHSTERRCWRAPTICWTCVFCTRNRSAKVKRWNKRFGKSRPVTR